MDRGSWPGCSPWGCKESDMTERLSTAQYICRYMQTSPQFHNIFTIPKETSNSLACTSYFPSVLHASVTMNLLIVSVDLPCRFVEWQIHSVYLHKQNQTVRLASFTQHNVPRVHPSDSTDQYVIPFYDWVIFYCVDRPQFTCQWMDQSASLAPSPNIHSRPALL